MENEIEILRKQVEVLKEFCLLMAFAHRGEFAEVTENGRTEPREICPWHLMVEFDKAEGKL